MLRRSSSSQAKVGLRLLSSSHLLVTFKRIWLLRRASYADSWLMKVALISRSGLREFKNSSDFNSDHLYLRMMYAARAHVALLCPRTEWTRTDSVASRASSINSKIALAASSLGSRSSCSLNFKSFLLGYPSPARRMSDRRRRWAPSGFRSACRRS